MNLCEFEASLVYRVSSRTARDTQRNPVPKTNQQPTQLDNKNLLFTIVIFTLIFVLSRKDLITKITLAVKFYPLEHYFIFILFKDKK